MAVVPVDRKRGGSPGAARRSTSRPRMTWRDDSEFDLGAVPPLGGSRRDPVVIDSRLAGCNSVELEAGSHVESVRIPTGDLLRVAEAVVADICADWPPCRRAF
jgi:prolyl-tRNA editing enzyme YbaK/EbsC (Cys-tRNA(Pro) deacylase)